MNRESNTLTRREALVDTLKFAVAATVAAPVITTASDPSLPQEPKCILENDYPFFGPEPESHGCYPLYWLGLRL